MIDWVTFQFKGMKVKVLVLTAISVLSIFTRSRYTSDEGVPVRLTSRNKLSPSSLSESDVGEITIEGV